MTGASRSLTEPRLELSSFVGGDLVELGWLLQRAHLLTLIGPPGVGKSRLARRVADDFASANSGRVGVLDFDAQAWGTDGTIEELHEQRYASPDQPLVVVLDNCDRHLDACREIVAAVLERDPSVKLIATCRQRIGSTVEHVWYVHPLSVPSLELYSTPDAAATSPAVQLFAQRAQEIDASFTLTPENEIDVAAICRAVDGLPLAIELAAAHLSAMSVRTVAEHVDTAIRLHAQDGDDRSRMTGIGRSIEWTASQFDDRQRAFLWGLSVFEGSWDLDSAREVCAESSAPHDVAQMLAQLVACSLARKLENQRGSQVRYALLGVVRRYAANQLQRSGESDALRRRHADWCLRTAESLAIASGSLESLQQLQVERANLLAALAWAVSASAVDMAFSLSRVLHAVWYIKGEYVESREWFRKVLGLSGGNRLERAIVMYWSATHAIEQCDFQDVRTLLERMRQEATALQHPLLEALCLDALAMTHLAQGDLRRAEGILLEELARLQLDSSWLRRVALCRLARLRLEQRQLESAQDLAAQALELFVADEHAWTRVRVMHVLGSIALEQGDFGSSREYLTSALDLARQLEDTCGCIDVLLDVSRLEAALANGREARATIREALELSERTAAVLPFIRVLEAVVTLRAAARPEAALHLAGAVSALRELHSAGRAPGEDGRYTVAVGTAREQLRPMARRAALRSGHTLDRPAFSRLARELLRIDPTPADAAAQLPPLLTVREMQIARLLAAGLTNRAIGSELFISEGTVRAHVEHILSKLDLRSRVEVGARLTDPDLFPTFSPGPPCP